MESLRSSRRDFWEEGLELPYKLARERLNKISDLEEQCRRSGARYVESNKIVIDYLYQPYWIVLPGAEILFGNDPHFIGVEVPLRDKILILHYFTQAKGTPATGRLISYEQLPGGVSYFPAFFRRAIVPFARHFGKNPELLLKGVAKFGGREAKYGDLSVTVNAFDRVSITLVLWRGDEELGPNGNMLFDANICDYLSTEDITVLSETIIWKLVKGSVSA